MPTRSKPQQHQNEAREHRLLERYRAAVSELIEAQYDLELTWAHLRRTTITQEQTMIFISISRELRRRVEPFRDIEPQHYEAIAQKLKSKYEVLDAHNIRALKAKLKERRKDHANKPNGKSR